MTRLTQILNSDLFSAAVAIVIFAMILAAVGNMEIPQ